MLYCYILLHRCVYTSISSAYLQSSLATCSFKSGKFLGAFGPGCRPKRARNCQTPKGSRGPQEGGPKSNQSPPPPPPPQKKKKKHDQQSYLEKPSESRRGFYEGGLPGKSSRELPRIHMVSLAGDSPKPTQTPQIHPGAGKPYHPYPGAFYDQQSYLEKLREQ